MSKESDSDGAIVKMFRKSALTPELSEMIQYLDEQFHSTFEANDEQIQMMREQLGYLRRYFSNPDAFHLALRDVYRRIHRWDEAQKLFGERHQDGLSMFFPELISGGMNVFSINRIVANKNRSYVNIFFDLDRVFDFRYRDLIKPYFEHIGMSGATVAIREPGLTSREYPIMDGPDINPYFTWFSGGNTMQLVSCGYAIKTIDPHPTIAV